MADPFQMPDDLKGKTAEDIAQMYLDTRKQYDEYKGQWEPRSKDWEAYSGLGKADELKQVYDWARGVAAPIVTKIQKGEAYLLNDADYKAYKAWADKTANGTRQPAENASDDLFAPMRQEVEQQILAQVMKAVEEKAQGYDQQIAKGFKTLQDQLNLFGHVSKLQKQYPNLDFDALLKKGADMANMPADQLLSSLIDSETKLSGMEAEIEKRVAAKLAEKEAVSDNDRVKTLLDSRKISGSQPSQRPRREDTIRGLVETLNGKFPGVYERIPLA